MSITPSSFASRYVLGCLSSLLLWIDPAPGMSQAEVWLERFTNDFHAAADHLAQAGVVRCDPIEPLPEGFRGGWITSPANTIHMVREPDTW